jgi:hypothetical protein
VSLVPGVGDAIVRSGILEMCVVESLSSGTWQFGTMLSEFAY